MPTAKKRTPGSIPKLNRKRPAEHAKRPGANPSVPTKKQEAEILKTYYAIWDAVLKGDMKTFASYLDNHVTIYGSAEGEIFNTRKAAAKFYTATADEMTGKVDLRNRKIGVKAFGNAALIHEECDLYVLTGKDWAFYGHARITEVLKREGGTWKISHHHTSFPDHRTEAGQQFAAEKIQAENLQLREAVKRRTVELETKNRELEIENGLEKVRAVAMGMQTPSDLTAVCKTLYEELVALGFTEMRNAQINIHNDDQKTLLNYDYMPELGTSVTLFEYASHPTIKNYVNQIRKGKDFGSFCISAGELLAWRRLRKKAGEKEDTKLKKAKALFYCFYSIGKGAIGISALSKLSDEKLTLLKKFRNVFNLAYRRYEDISKAEAQARQAQIETALEKIRARALAMHKADELLEVAKVMRTEMAALGVEELETSSIYTVKSDGTAECWYAIKDVRGKNSKLVFDEMTLGLKATQVGRQMLKFFTGNDAQTSILMKGEQRKEWINYCASRSNVLKGYYGNEIPERTYHLVKFAHGYVGAATPGNISSESWSLLQRMTTVFSLAYTRFLDLQKAEEQAREAQIEAALERVRAKTMAMHKSEQLPETAQVLFEQFAGLGKIPDRIAIGIVREESQVIEWWATDQTGSQLARHFDTSIHAPIIGQYFAAWKQGKESIVIDLAGKRLKEWVAYVREVVKMPIDDSKMKGRRVHHGAFFSHGLLLISAHEPMPQETMHLLVRFAKVFSQTYTRFLDLQKAEAQAREAQIEAALERVRSRSMAMHNSEELPEVIQLVFEQLRQLNFNIDSAQFDLNFRESDDLNLWTAVPGQPYPTQQHIPYFNNAVFNSVKHAKEAGLNLSVHNFTFEEKNEFFNYFFKHTSVPEERRKFILSLPGWARSVVYLDRIYLGIQNYSGIPYSDTEHAILGRFAKVFEQAYTRFLDLQRAEANAREATIEAALERVRSKAMAMHTSEEVGQAIHSLFAELDNLKLRMIRCGIVIIHKEKYMLAWTTSIAEGNRLTNVSGKIDMSIHPLLNLLYESWLAGEEFFYYELEGEVSIDYYMALAKVAQYKLPDIHEIKGKHYCQVFMFKEGGLYAFTPDPIGEHEALIFRRFANVFTLTYQRYQDLQVVESRAKEAVKQAALDRVRAEIASMRTVSDLDRITPLIWRELTTLGIPFVRCGVFIMDEEKQLIHTFLSTPEGKAIAAFHLPYSSSPFFDAMEEWRAKKIHITHWDTEGFAALAESLVKEGQIATPEQYLRTVPKEGLYLHYVPFLQGILYVGNTQQLPDDHLHLIQSVADAFSTAYARYEDFNKLEAAKTQVENTLKDLRAAQNQLVQSEKMASLGELTAGIAHEIQNPLNFVNNFSEVSNELMDELKQELARLPDGQAAGSPDASGQDADMYRQHRQLADELVKDIKQNLEKINFHGKRAADIVKGMLQHSRTSTGQKELTDLNALCDEYLRLAYHGLMAKDKSFNSKFETNFDPSLPKVSVIPQDIGRVVLNLINNAFYAVSEWLRQAQPDSGYEPRVTVATKNLGNKIEIMVKDNGTGIPEKVKEKIFQPFFTTKPTGQGTGLGLSLSYDIVKAHGGELKVETKEGEGSEFIIMLPQ
jgi:signal transduction histidine kinase/ketosteroid isomerase-like protein